MAQVIISIPEETLTCMATSPAKAFTELRMLAAVKLFELKKMSSGAAARLAGISRVEFLDRLGDYGVPTFQQTDQELRDEISNA